jgi:hypothetical protein
MSDYDDEPERTVAPTKHSTRAKVALGVAIAAVVASAAMRSTVAGESQLAATAVGGDSSAILASTLGFAAVAILVIGAIIVALDPIITNRGRRMAVAALITAIAAPLLGAGLEALVAALFS